MRENRRSERFVVPGERLGVIEEFDPGDGTYSEDGTIYSLVSGQVHLDLRNKRISIHPLGKAPLVPMEGDIIIGQITTVQDKMANVRILEIDAKPSQANFTAVIHVSTASQDYVGSLNEVFKVGDVLRAKVISVKNRTYQLATTEPELGVLYASCSKCGSPLTVQGPSLGCPSCRNMERRKIAKDYGSFSMY
jgi:exosome complex component CSL4